MKNIIKGIILSLFIVVTGFIFTGCDEVSLEKIQIVGLPTENIVVGQTFELSVVFEPENASDKRCEWWTPSNDIIKMEVIAEEYVTIETLAIGEAIVYARAFDGNLTDSVTINVTSGTLNLRFQGSVNGVVTRNYNGQPQEVMVAGGYDNVNYLYRKNGETEYSTTAPTNVGTYDIRAEVNTQNYSGFCEGTLTILPQEIMIYAINKEIGYGDEDIALTYRVEGTFFDDVPNINGSLKREEGKNAGNYRIMQDESFSLATEDRGNYLIKFIEGNYYIKPAPITVSVSATSVYYGQEVTDISYSVLDDLIYDDQVNDLNIAISMPENARNAGNYTLLCEYDNTNYDITFTNNRVNIFQAPIIVKVGSGEKKYKYDDPETYSYEIYNAKNVADTTKLFYDDTLLVEFTRNSGENVGNYAVYPLVSGSCASNYSVTYQAGTLTIKPRQVCVQVDDATIRYGQDKPKLTYNLVEGYDEIIDNELNINPCIVGEAENVGEYPITAIAIQMIRNYEMTCIDGMFTITPALVTLKVEDSTKVYGDSDPTFTFVVDEQGDPLKSNHNATFSYARANGEDVGNYNVSLIIETADPNYTFSTISGLLTITKRNLVYNVGDLTMRYFQDLDQEEVTFTLDTEKGNSNVNNLVIEDCVSVDIPLKNGVGTYPLSITLTQALPNYDIEFVGGNLIISQANIKVKMTDLSTYYGIIPSYTTEFLADSDEIKSDADQIELTIPDEYQKILDAGTYEIMVQANQPNENYNIIIEKGTLEVKQAEIFVSVVDEVITYGTQPTFEYTQDSISGAIVDGEFTLDFAYSGTDVGEYVVSMTINQIKSNYKLNVTDGTLTINQANVIYNIDAKTFKYGDKFSFTYSIDESSDAIINNELTIALFGSQTAVGVYDIEYQVTEKDGKENYNVVVNNAKYEVIKRHYIFKIEDTQKELGESDPSYSYTLTSESDSILEEDFSLLKFVFERESGETAGTYIISATAESNDHFEVTIYSGTLTIVEPEEEPQEPNEEDPIINESIKENY